MARVTKNKFLFLPVLLLLSGPISLSAQELPSPDASTTPSLPVLVAPPLPDTNPFDGRPTAGYNDFQTVPVEPPLLDDFEGLTEEFDGSLPLPLFDVPVIELPTDSSTPSTRVMRIGRFTLLHKVTAKIRPLELRLDEPVEIDDLRITMHDCLSTPPEEPPETKVFLTILENKNGEEKRLFNGWMFASSPGINALEHAVYDLWPKACVGADDMPFTGE